jgi:hypothetical protein
MAEQKPINDPSLYRRMSEPHESLEAANAAWLAFYADVRAAREKHRIPDVLIVAELPFIDNGEESRAPVCSTIGNARIAVELAAFAYGQEVKAKDRRIASAVMLGEKAAKEI